MDRQNRNEYVGRTTGLSTIGFDPYLDYSKFRLKTKKVTKTLLPQNMGKRFLCPWVEKNKPKCLWSFDKKAHLDRHMNSHCEVGVYVCQMCNSTSKYNYNVYEHWKNNNCKVFNPGEFSKDPFKEEDIKTLIRMRMERLGRLSEFHLHEGCVFILNPNFLMDCLEYIGDSHNETCNICSLSFNVIYKNFHRDVHLMKKRIDDLVLQDAYFCSLCSIGVETQEQLYDHWRSDCELAILNGSQNDLTNEELAALAFTMLQESIPVEYYYTRFHAEMTGRRDYVKQLKQSPNIANAPNNDLYFYTGALCINENKTITNDKIFNQCAPLDWLAKIPDSDEKLFLLHNRENALVMTCPFYITETGYWEKVCGPNGQIKTVFVYSADNTVLSTYNFTPKTKPTENCQEFDMWYLRDHSLQCSSCPRLFSRESGLLKHYEFHAAEKFCVLCKSQFKTIQSLESHWKLSCPLVKCVLTKHVRRMHITSKHMRILIVGISEIRQKSANDLDSFKIWLDAFAEWLLSKPEVAKMEQVRDLISKLDQGRVNQMNQGNAIQAPNYQNIHNPPVQNIQRPQYQQQQQTVRNVQRPTNTQNFVSQRANPLGASIKMFQPTIEQQRQQEEENKRGLGIRNVPVQSFYKQSREKARRLNLDTRQIQQQSQTQHFQGQQLEQRKQLQPQKYYQQQQQQPQRQVQQPQQIQQRQHQQQPQVQKSPQRPQKQQQIMSANVSQMGTSSRPINFYDPPENSTLQLVKLTNSSFYKCVPNYVPSKPDVRTNQRAVPLPIPGATSQLNTLSHPVASQPTVPGQRQYVYRVGNKRPVAASEAVQPAPKRINVGTQTPMIDVQTEFEKFKAEYNKRFSKKLNEALSKFETSMATVPDIFMKNQQKQPALVPVSCTPIQLRDPPVPNSKVNLPPVRDLSEVQENDSYYPNLDTYAGDGQPDYTPRGRFNLPPVFSSPIPICADDTNVKILTLKEQLEKNRKKLAPSTHCLYDTGETLELRRLDSVPEYVQADDAVLLGCTAITFFLSGDVLSGGYLLKDMDDYQYWVCNPTHKRLPQHGEHIDVNDNNVIVRCIALNVIHEEEGIILLFPYSSFTGCCYNADDFPLLYTEPQRAIINNQQPPHEQNLNEQAVNEQTPNNI